MIATADDPAPIPAARTRLAPPAYRRYETLAEYRAALDELVGLAQRTLWLFDITLEPRFGSRERVGQLRNFLRRHPENRLRIAVHDARPLARDCPRLIELQRQHGGAFAIHETTGTARSATLTPGIPVGIPASMSIGNM